MQAAGPRGAMFQNPESAFWGRQEMLSLIELIYSGVGAAERWPGILDRLNAAVGAEQTIIFGPVTQAGAAISAGTGEQMLRDFLSHYAGVNVLAGPCDRMFPTGDVRYSHKAVPDVEFERSEFYNDFFQQHNAFYSMGLKVPLGARGEAYLSSQRPRSKGPFGESEGLVYATLMPHLQRALMLHARMTQMETGVLGLEAALDDMGHAVFGLDGVGRVILSNQRAEELVRGGDALLLRNRRLASVVPEMNRRLQEALACAADVGTATGVPDGSSLLLERRSGGPALRVTVTPFAAAMAARPSDLAALVYVSDPGSKPQSRAESMRKLYKLTPAEGRIADLLLEGLEVREVSQRLGVTLETARFHVKRVLAKTGVRRQSELVRLMLGLPGAGAA